MPIIHTRYGDIPVHAVLESYPDGSPKSCVPSGPVELDTPLGRLMPQYTTDDLRRKEVQPLRFHANGRLRSLPLERAAEVRTPAGTLDVELLTFHPHGAVQRVFPLNGRLTGYWAQEDERGLAREVELQLPWGLCRLTPLGLCFDARGRWRSLTLWPGEVLETPTPLGVLSARTGVSFLENGQVASLEPAKALSVPTPIGECLAFDSDAVGVCGDKNSLRFDAEGRVIGLRTVQTIVGVDFADGTGAGFAPKERESLCGNGDREPIPMELIFREHEVIIRQTPEAEDVRVPYAGSVFRVRCVAPRLRVFTGCSV